MPFAYKTSIYLLVFGLIFSVTDIAAEIIPNYPPNRDGTAPAIATLNVTLEMLEYGEKLYKDNCVSCHGIQGHGKGSLSPYLMTKPKNLSEARSMNYISDMDLANFIRYGGFEMPAHPHIQGNDLIALVAFVRSLSYSDLREIELHPLAQSRVNKFIPVSSEMLEEPPADDWLMYRRTYNSWGYSPLSEINRNNISELRLAWSRAMEPGEQETTPLIHNGVMYLANPGDVIQALDAKNGDLIWEYRHGTIKSGKTRVRNIAIYEDKIFHFTKGEQHLIALHAATGALIWEVPVAGNFSSGPIVANGHIISGRSCSPIEGPDVCFIAAYDPDDGSEIWRTRLIPRPDEPGGNTWGDLPYEERRHVGAWGVGSYDPNLNLIFWGTSVPAPSLERVRGTPGGDVLYSNSTLAINADSGEIVWYYQHLPRDNWDLDHVFERYLIETQLSPDSNSVQWINPSIQHGETRKIVTGIPGKTGIIYTLDRETGEFLWARETLNQNIINNIDPENGKVQINEQLVVDAFEEILVCPGRSGGKNWPAGAYSPLTGLMYQPQQNLCMLHIGNTTNARPEDVYASTVFFVEDPSIKEKPYPVGRVDAVSIQSGHTAWLHQQRAGMISGLVATGGGLVFGGDVNRRFKAFDDKTGEVLWETILSAPVSAHPVSYGVNGKQYIAIPVGGATAEPERRVLSVHPEIKPSRGINAIFVFTLPNNSN